MIFKRLLSSLSKVYAAYQAIESDTDLRKNNLTLADYNAFPVVFEKLQRESKAKCVSESLARFFEKHGFAVNLNGVNYEISLE